MMPNDGQTRVSVNPVTFDEIPGQLESEAAPTPGNLGLIMDVSVPVTVSIGTVRRQISEILAITPGQVLKLDRVAGEPVDLHVNDKLIARGEVVVVDERYGIRITEIVAPEQRLQGMQGLAE